MKDSCIFCKIAKREIPAEIIYEDDACVVIPDKFPNTKGQSLVIVKKHVPYAFDLDDKTYAHLFSVAKKIAKAIDKAFGPERTCLVVEGFHVPHTHLKIFPTYGKGLEIHMGPEASDSELKKIADSIRKRL